MDTPITAWDSLSILKNIPENVTSEIDILHGASIEFIEEVAKLESIDDYKERGLEAIKFLKEHNGFDLIPFTLLISYLSDYEGCPISIWRQLYILERSIPPRKNAITKTWVERLKIFADTYVLEHIVDHSHLVGLPGIVAFTRNSGDHENLHAGQGSYAADFYCWDKLTNTRHAWVEFKHWGTVDIEAAKEYYLTKKYSARYVLVFLADHTYKLIDYQENTIIEQPQLAVPNLLIW